MKHTDSQIQQAVLRELRWDTRVKETDVGVEIDDGVVTLTGIVESWAERAAAEAAAHRVDGVLDVANDIVVKLPGTPGYTDTQIASAVRHLLDWCCALPRERIHSTVADGVVTLRGSVDYASEREDAERALRYLNGVRRIVNEIEVKPAAQPSPTEIREAIVAALQRQAHREAKGIAVDVQGGCATLKGIVHSLREKEAMLGAARGTRGVTQVESELIVQPWSA